MNVRLACSNDQAEIASLTEELGYAVSRHSLTKNLSAILQSGDHLLLVAESDDKSIVGWIHVFKAVRVESETFAEIGGFVVHGPMRGQGIGLGLLNEAESWVRSQGIQKLRVRTRSQRARARSFYQRSGFFCTKEQVVFDKSIV
ncbi:GNAT family N-acetyltransferase [Motiliproteus sp. MSK22-1]|uniref:GNAT family N-acetyltransferase n=1 Tax=Motiliproteus sp. MSK22-1 TaxID=1897630 RepID=UPI000977B8D5|nr:GNAT family N-acetyltransferase [Motiliproteus sp. MSK22-1]OMH38270.1 hypothetical protein BGP75_08470 [Motiliproteus sp. MSK22-1]